MTAEIIAVGTELLLGDILNTNAQFLSKELAQLGIGVYAQTVVGDNAGRLKAAIVAALSRADMVVLSGGLGPTDDDITKETAAEVFGQNLIFHQEIYDKILSRISKNAPETNKKQAYVPEDAYILTNDNGTAPGIVMEKDEKMLILLPGPPAELEPMFLNFCLPVLKQKTNCVIVSETIRLFGIGEAQVGETVRDLAACDNPTVAPYVKNGDVTLRITARAESEAACAGLIAPAAEEIRSRFGDFVYGTGETDLKTKVVQYLIDNRLTVATAESCTAGMIAAAIGDIPGVSDIFCEGFVTYSNDAKEKNLGVPGKILKSFGAVSAETARAMAEGVCNKTNAKIGISATGIAGPGGGTKDKPVGLVYIGVCVDGETSVRKCQLKGNRDRVRFMTVLNAFDEVRKRLNISS